MLFGDALNIGAMRRKYKKKNVAWGNVKKNEDKENKN